jgi:hypothetical protein
MYNRTNESQNISQFMNGQQIPEEEDNTDNNAEANLQTESKPLEASNSILKSKIDEDFMFQMDKGKNFSSVFIINIIYFSIYIILKRA